VVGLEHSGTRIKAVVTRGPDGRDQTRPVEQVISSIPLTVLVKQMSPAPPQAVWDAAHDLRFRHLRTVNLVLDRPHLFPDQWVYVHDPELTVGRVQNFGSWSPWMLADPSTSCVGMEYFCSTGDSIWEASDEALIAQATDELRRAGLADGAKVLDASTVRVPRAYPVYDQHYQARVDTIRSWLATVDNLQAIGRYGMFKYNNSDHSVLTALLAAENLFGAEHDVWAVNTDTEYHEVRPGRSEGRA
jgi:protoporphyrinogen oxidase